MKPNCLSLSVDFSFGRILRDARASRGITLREASRILRMDCGNLSKLERSELDPPRTITRIDYICKKLKIESHSDLLKSVAFQHHLAILKKEFGL